MSLLATVNGRGTLAARPAAAAANEGYVYSASDAALYRSNGSSWDTIASTGLADQGTFTFLDGTVAAAPATPAAGKLRLYAKTGKVLAVKDDAGLETLLGAGSLGAWTSYTPTWTTDGTAPTLGNGTVTGQYKQLDATAYLVIINFSFGSTSAVGTGNFRFALPFTAGASFEQTFAGRVLDNGTAHYVAIGLIAAATAYANVVVADATGVRLAAGGVPITWATGDQINLQGVLYV